MKGSNLVGRMKKKIHGRRDYVRADSPLKHFTTGKSMLENLAEISLDGSFGQ